MRSPHPTPTSSPERPRSRRPPWAVERLEGRVLLSTVPITVGLDQLAAAVPIEAGTVTGTVQAGSTSFFRIDIDQFDPATLAANLHAPGATARLVLIDAQGEELARSDGISAADRDAAITEYLNSGTDYLEVIGLE